ncbi:MAG: DUF805 domain-containing protein [Rhizobiaceae bacterium]|nr:DUF805 domain-containing protein [Rhizobiaceae bacterium]
MFFGLSGRISRAAYFLAGLLLYLARFFPVYRILINSGSDGAQTFWGGAFLLTIGITLVCHIALAVKRLHDLNASGWFALVFLVGDFLFYLALCLVPGTQGSNTYGSRTNAP